MTDGQRLYKLYLTKLGIAITQLRSTELALINRGSGQAVLLILSELNNWNLLAEGVYCICAFIQTHGHSIRARKVTL